MKGIKKFQKFRTKFLVGIKNEKKVLLYIRDHPEILKPLKGLIEFARERLGYRPTFFLDLWEELTDRHIDFIVRKPTSDKSIVFPSLDSLILKSEELLQKNKCNGWIHVTFDLETGANGVDGYSSLGQVEELGNNSND